MRRPSGLALLATLVILSAPAGAGSAPVWPEPPTAPGATDDLVERAEQIRRLHLAELGLDAALGGAQSRIDQIAARRVQAEIRLEQAEARVRRLRQALGAATGRAIVAARLAQEPGQDLRQRSSLRWAVLRAGTMPWRQAEQALLEAETTLVRLDRAKAQGEAAMAALDGLAGQLGQARSRIDDLPLAVLALDMRHAAMPDDAVALQPGPAQLGAADGTAGPAPLGLALPEPGELDADLGWPVPALAMPIPAAPAPPAWDGVLADLPALPSPAGTAARHGIVLNAPASGTVLAPEAGKVVFAGAFRSYGQILIIDHGNGYHTLMAGFARLAVDAGAVVLAGERVGTVDAGSGGPNRLYVEVRRRGVPVDPMPWLAAREDKVRG